LPKVVEKAHANNLRVSTHVENAADFHYAIAAGADEIAHLPFRTSTLIGVEDAKLAAKRGIVDLLPRILEDERADERSDPEQGKRPPRGRDERLTLGGVVVPPPSAKLSEVRGRWNRRRTEPLQASVESSCAE